ncbi:ferrous-iron efflux pump FieF [Gammaproteobacteria bacterium]
MVKAMYEKGNAMHVQQGYEDGRRATWMGMFSDIALTLLKGVFGILGQSQSLVADGLHSLADVIVDLIVLFAARHGQEAPDAEHPYGHARIETAASVGMGLVLFLIAVGLIWDAVERLFDPARLLTPGKAPLFIAAFSLLVKEALYQYTMVLAKRYRSPLLQANAWHHRSDSISSLVVLIGVAGTRAGLHYLDALGAVVVGTMILQVAWELSSKALRELIDTGLERERVADIERAILSVHGVQAMHLLRTRQMGANALVDVHILLSIPEISVSEGHQISETVRAKLIQEIEEVVDVVVHIDPEDDEKQSSCLHLPLRDQVLAKVDELWKDIPGITPLQEVILHYLDGKVHLDVVLPLDVLAEEEYLVARTQEIEAVLHQAVAGDPQIGQIRVRFEAGVMH